MRPETKILSVLVALCATMAIANVLLVITGLSMGRALNDEVEALSVRIDLVEIDNLIYRVEAAACIRTLDRPTVLQLRRQWQKGAAR